MPRKDQPLKRGERIERRNIEIICTATRNIVLGEDQFWCETPKAYELWGPLDDPHNWLIYFLKRFPKKSVYWVQEK